MSNGEMKMIPFNLERALAGDPVVTRDGEKVIEIFLFESALDDPLMAIIKDDYGHIMRESFYKNGAWVPDKESNLDLFMAPKTKTIWFNVYPANESGHHIIGHGFETESQAMAIAGNHGKTYSLEIEV